MPLLLLAPIHWAFFVESRRLVFGLSAGLALAILSPALYEHHPHVVDIAGQAAAAVTVFFIAGAVLVIRRRLRAAERRLRIQSDHDALTGLLNRRGFDRAVRRIMGERRD